MLATNHVTRLTISYWSRRTTTRTGTIRKDDGGQKRRGGALTDGVAQKLGVEPPGQELTLHQRPNLFLLTQRGHLQVEEEEDNS